MQQDLFYNTVGETGRELQIAYQKAIKCQEAVKIFFTKNSGSYTPAEVFNELQKSGYNFLLTSVRRSVTNLTNDGILEKLAEKRKGNYGANNLTWKLKLKP